MLFPENRYNNQKRMIVECCLPENRVWGSEFENRTFTGAATWLSSTTRPGCAYRCDGIASVSTVQRYYASSYGRFNTADPYQASAGPKDPGSWNRYAYTRGDPVNRIDPRGLDDFSLGGLDFSGTGSDDGTWGYYGGLTAMDCYEDPEECEMDDWNSILYDQPQGPGGSGGGGGSPPPTCEQLLSGAISAFLTGKGSPLAGDVSEIMTVAQNDNLDPTLIAAIAIAENGQKMNNPFALGPNGSNTYGTLDAAIAAAGSTLDKYIYTWNETTVSSLWSGNTWKVNPKKPWITIQPPGYCVGTTAAGVTGCQNTGKTISGFMQSMGKVATVGGNPNKLGFPCPN
jgi:RHS repeat-associated protein